MLRRLAVLAAFALLAVAPAQLKVGAPAPEPGLEKVVSPSVGPGPTLASLRGKAVLLEFWGTWCGHCIQALPHLEKLHGKYAARGVEFLSVTDEREKLVLEFLKDTKMAGKVVLDTDSSAFKAYEANALPTSVLIDRAGNIAGVMHPEHITDEIMEDLLAGRPLKLKDAAKGETATKPPIPALVELSVRPSLSKSRAAGIGLNELNTFGTTALDTISMAFRVPENRVLVETELPTDYYDVVAKGPEGSDVAYAMLEAALRTALNLDIVRETRDLEVYVIRRIEGQAPKVEKPEGKRSGGTSQTGAAGTDSDLRMLTAFLDRKGKKPVIDESGLKDRYNWSIKTNATDFEGLRAALREQMGLDLVREKRPMPVVVVRKKA
ncbi:MAG: TIGR03435 family protein [Fimbriimonas sp.]